MNEQAKNALAKWREDNKGVSIPKLSPTERAAANPKSKTLAIKAMCWECSGAQRGEIKNCAATKCPLWIHRPYVSKTDVDSTEELTYHTSID